MNPERKEEDNAPAGKHDGSRRVLLQPDEWKEPEGRKVIGEYHKDGLPGGMAVPFAVGMTAAAVSGFAAIWFLLGYLRRHTFRIFVIYRLVVAVVLLIVITAGLRHATGI